MYFATSHIGRDYVPGEILPDNLPDETIQRLLEAGAICKAAPAFGTLAEDEEPTQEKLGDTPGQVGKNGKTYPNAEKNAAAEDEIDEAPEIDAMDGLVSTDTTAETRKSRKTSQKASNTAKGGKAQ